MFRPLNDCDLINRSVAQACINILTRHCQMQPLTNVCTVMPYNNNSDEDILCVIDSPNGYIIYKCSNVIYTNGNNWFKIIATDYYDFLYVYLDMCKYVYENFANSYNSILVPIGAREELSNYKNYIDSIHYALCDTLNAQIDEFVDGFTLTLPEPESVSDVMSNLEPLSELELVSKPDCKLDPDSESDSESDCKNKYLFFT